MKRPAGTGTIERTEDGRFRPRLPRAYGRRYLEPCDTEEEAAAAILVAMSEQPPPEELTLSAWGERWIEHRKSQGYRSTAHELRRWKRVVGQTNLGRTPLRQIRRQDVQRWVDRMKGSRKTASNALGLVRGALRWAVREGQIGSDPTEGVQLPPGARAGSTWDWLRAHEVEALLAAADGPKQRAVFAVAIYAGLRAGELWALRWQDVDSTEHVIRVTQAVGEDGTIGPTKTGRPREVPLLAPARGALDEWRPHCPERNRLGLVFQGRYGGPHPRGHRAGLYDALDRAGVRRVRFHDLRHTCASHLIQGTWAPWIVSRPLRLEEVQQWLGHSTRVMTERYAHLAPDGLRGLRVAYDGPVFSDQSGDPKGIRISAVGAYSSAEEAIRGAIGQVVGRLAGEVRAALYDGPPEHAWHRVLRVLRRYEESYPVPLPAALPTPEEVGRG